MQKTNWNYPTTMWVGQDRIKDLTKATIRCITLDANKEQGKGILTGAPSERRVLFAKAYLIFFMYLI